MKCNYLMLEWDRHSLANVNFSQIIILKTKLLIDKKVEIVNCEARKTGI